MRNTREFTRIAAFGFLAACGASQTPRHEVLAQQSIFADANAPSIYDAGPPPARVIVDASVDDEDSTDANSADQDVPDDAVKPLAITPTLAESAVRTGLEIFITDDGAPFIAAIEKHVTPGRVENLPFGAELDTPLAADGLAFRLLNFKKESSKLVYVLRNGKRAAGVAIAMSADNRQILPVEWLRAVISFKGVDEKTSRPWYVGMSQRLAVAGRSSGIVIFDNGTAAGVLMEARGEVGGDDLTVMAHTEFFPVGGFDVSAWGPMIKNVKGVLTKNGDGHAGVDARDLLSRALH
jgi:hypothetical protein